MKNSISVLVTIVCMTLMASLVYAVDTVDKNQTPPDVMKRIGSGKINPDQDKGYAAFLVPDPEKGANEYKAIYVKDITYGETTKRAEQCVAFQWIPIGYQDITSWPPRPPDRCAGLFCGPGPGGGHDWCPPGCFCFGNYCRRF